MSQHEMLNNVNSGRIKNAFEFQFTINDKLRNCASLATN